MTAPGAYYRPESPDADQAVVYIYRKVVQKPEITGYPEIFVNGERKFRLLLGGYGVVKLPPGQYEILARGSFWTDWPHPDLTRRIEVKAGEEYYVRVWRERPPPGGSPAMMSLVSKYVGVGEIYRARLVTALD